MRSQWAFCVALLLLIGAPVALAQSDGAPSSYDLEEAHRLFEEAKAHYNLFEYEEALKSFKRAYLLSKEPDLLVNIGQCYRYLKRPEEAVKTLKLFLLEVPDGPLTPSVKKLIAEIEASPESVPAQEEPVVTEPQSEPTSAPALPMPDAPPEVGRKKPHLIFYTSAAITGGAGLLLGGLATLSAFQARDAEGEGDVGSAGRLRAQAKTMGLVADVNLVAAFLSGGVGYLLSRRTLKREYSVTLAPFGAFVSVRF